MNIRVTKAELDHENVESVALPEGGGYLSWIGAFHQLHCIVCDTTPLEGCRTDGASRIWFGNGFVRNIIMPT